MSDAGYVALLRRAKSIAFLESTVSARSSLKHADRS
jgi:hypothetical protein